MAQMGNRPFARRYRYYEILEIDRAATQDEIRRAYLKLAKIYHPDVNPDAKAHEKFKKINEAYEVLCDITQRASYDRSPAECPICWTHEVIHTVEYYWRCRHCGCRFNPYKVSEVIKEVEKYTISGRRQHIKTIFQATQCSRCRKFYTQPFLCPSGRLQSNCVSFDRLGDEERRHLMDDDKWWWRMADMIQQVQDKGIMGRCRECGALNPNPQKTVCWQCGKNTLCCPSCPESPILRYNIEKNLWKCPNAVCGRKFAIKQRKISTEPTLTKESCTNCGQNLYYDSELLLWRCKRCKRIYTYDDLNKKQRPAREDRAQIVVCPNCTNILFYDGVQGLWRCERCHHVYRDSDLNQQHPQARGDIRRQEHSKKNTNYWMVVSILALFGLALLAIGVYYFLSR